MTYEESKYKYESSKNLLDIMWKEFECNYSLYWTPEQRKRYESYVEHLRYSLEKTKRETDAMIDVSSFYIGDM